MGKQLLSLPWLLEITLKSHGQNHAFNNILLPFFCGAHERKKVNRKKFARGSDKEIELLSVLMTLMSDVLFAVLASV